MEKNVVIGVDFGSDSVRSVVINGKNGEKLGTGECRYPRWKSGLYQNAEMKIFRQHPLDYLESMEICIKNALDQAGATVREQVLSISIDATGSTPCPVNRQGVPLAMLEEFSENENAMFHLWKDHSAIEESLEINKAFSNFRGINYTKYQGTYSSEWFWAKILHTYRVDPKVKEASFSWVEHCDWIPAILSGQADPLLMYRCSCAAGHKALWHSEWHGLPDRECLNQIDPYLAKIHENYGQEPKPSDQKVGYICAEWADRLGLSIDTIIGGSSIDAHAGAVGAGIDRNIFVTNVGTSTVDMMVSDPEQLKGKNIVYASGQAEDSILPGLVGIEAGQAAFGDIYAWFTSLLMWPLSNLLNRSSVILENQKQLLINELNEKLIDELAYNAGNLEITGAMTALDWFNGRRYPYSNEYVKGAICGLSLSSDAPLIFQSLVLGTIFGLRRIVESWTNEGLRIDQMIAVGGIAKKSAYVMQLMADVLSYPINIASSDQTCATGAAIYAAVAGGLYSTIQQAQKQICEGFEKTYYPDHSKKDALNKAYHRYCEFGSFIEQF
ncbi:ribulokinase [Flexilinea flocculi]|uniref:Ribulose kinase n=1 Tax=Flexilinea flocculi TaxID=1678840 RepID=A0A0S7BRT2_9CHLR|nr:ribulokinase [Flexilinea flocculi]GAP40546.1 ribulose kinase [Flexilinea flocculi]